MLFQTKKYTKTFFHCFFSLFSLFFLYQFWWCSGGDAALVASVGCVSHVYRNAPLDCCVIYVRQFVPWRDDSHFQSINPSSAHRAQKTGLFQSAAADGRGQQLQGCRPHLRSGVGPGAAHHGQLAGTFRPLRGDEIQLFLPDALRGRLPVLPPTGDKNTSGIGGGRGWDREEWEGEGGKDRGWVRKQRPGWCRRSDVNTVVARFVVSFLFVFCCRGEKRRLNFLLRVVFSVANSRLAAGEN